MISEDDEADRRMRRTFRLELRRAAASGILETAAATFLLLVAVSHFQAGATAKAMLVAGGPLGLLCGPLAVAATRALGLRAATGAAACAVSGALGFLGAALVDHVHLFVACGALGIFSLTAGIPLMTQIYQENYPSARRGRLFSLAAMARVAAASIFAWLAGWWLDGRIGEYRVLMFTFSAAALAAAWFTWRCPSAVFTEETSSNPLAGLRHVRSDRVFRWLLASWMLMGLGNLLMLPLRVEFIANPRHGIALSPMAVALLVSMIPSVTNFVFALFWGRLYDTMNFFLLRIILNVCFMAAIAAFFLHQGMGGFVLGSVLFGMAASGGNVAWSLWVTKIAKPALVAEYMGVHTFLTGVRGLVAPFLAFWLIESWSISTLAWWSLGLMAVASIMLVPEARTLRRRRAANPHVPKPGGMI
ncbi:MAG: MFS transporter [Luteolibacter sp.]